MVFATARWVASALLCMGAQFASYDARADIPVRVIELQGCVLEGFFLRSPGDYKRLPYLDQVDWTKFESQTVRYKFRYGRGLNVLLGQPSAVGPCDAALVAAVLPHALATRAATDFMLQNVHEQPLADIQRAIKLAPQNCGFVAIHVFILERLGKRKEADAEAARVAGMTCSDDLYNKRLRELRDGSWSRLR